ncbi:MAG: hypothetical protein J7K21_03740, partial [Desulfurococcales archaeon]|nr:hypothetical protein [Desulfurococcales archaeon]
MDKVCEICGLEPTRYQCRLCGRHVCKKDYDIDTGLCSICVMTRCEICRKYPAIGYCIICGRIGCEDCLIQINPVSYICRDCRRRYSFEV